MQTINWTALASAVRDRREELGLRQQDIEGRGGPGVGTVRNIEQGSRDTYAPRTFRQLEHALDWSAGHVRRVLGGAEPDPQEGPSCSPDWQGLAKAVRDRRAELRLPVDLVSVGGPTEMTIRRIESGGADSIRPKTKTRLEHALQWEPGLVDRVLDRTADPSRLIGSAPAPRLSADDEFALQVGRMVVALVRSAGATP